MHDIRDLEDLGVVAVAVASSELRQAAAAQNRALGYDAAVIFVPHPIQDRTDEEMRTLADNVVDAILGSLKN
jgi:hypothetical protein